jgi:hypothetical protein
LVGTLNGRPKRAGCLPNDAAVTPAVTPAAVSTDSPVEECEAQYFFPSLALIWSANIASCHRISRAAISSLASPEMPKADHAMRNSHARNIEHANRAAT